MIYSLFPPFNVPGIGTFQDGGLRHNNPVNLALCEAEHIWPYTSTDMLLSLGTGKECLRSDSTMPTLGYYIRNSFLPRLVRSFLYSLSGEGPWRELVNRLNGARRSSYIRLNISLPVNERICLDDASRI